MRNVTLAIEDEVLQKARIRAVKEGTTVNEVIRKYLAEYASREERIQYALDRVLEIAAEYKGRIKGGKFNREEIYSSRWKRGK